MPPVKGWQYAAGGGKYQSDPTLECSRQVTPACKKIIVELDGGAKEKYPELAGSYLPVIKIKLPSYLPVEEKINRGRWVGIVLMPNIEVLMSLTVCS